LRRSAPPSAERRERRHLRQPAPYLEGAPVASDAFMTDVEDLPVQEREA